VDIGAAVGRKTGTDVHKLSELWRWPESDAFTALERDALVLAEEMAGTPANPPQELFDRLRAALGETGLVELASGIAWENYRARFNRVFDCESEGYDEGAVCVIPAAARV
jgi:alkylhydroperoxidase family enzyme